MRFKIAGLKITGFKRGDAPTSNAPRDNKAEPVCVKYLNALRHIVGFFLQPLKDAFGEIKVNSAVFLSAGGKVFWLVPFLVYPHLFSTFPAYYHYFAVAGPEWIWAIVILGLICIDLFVLIRKSFIGQVISLLLGALYWLFLAKQISAGVPHGLWNIPASPFAGVCLGSGIACMIANYRLIQAHNALSDAVRMLILGQRVEMARVSGEQWAQDTKTAAEQDTKQERPIMRDSRSVDRGLAATLPPLH